ncbi:TetR family transcriptional regulator [Mycolicibacterium canariasense]|uniref:TetR family transcriptional regulator n=1 Tax=Mycolicibacterium canariasense TaxID=228230 RepID=A0A117I8W8_MYCCR|nr:TetR/AcrR family transcriptional regulator [Mycolicibacterium canariasense]MCV7212858.1 TetR/AcrR family transcriptional regulator [Mycolicibacterium canariasense]GAS93830.1 TetR family transcriptional regulator [Mycolicibacterium canariasense]
MDRRAAGAPVRPSQAVSTTEAILQTAVRVFLAHGYEQSSMDAIALQAGVARRTLYNQFANKKALFDATMARLWASMPLDAIIESTAQVRPADEVLFTIGRTIAGFWAPPEAVAFMRLVIWESARFPEIGQSFMDSGREPARRAVHDYVCRLSEEPEFEIPDPDLATAQFIDVILGEVLLGRLVASSSSALDDDRCDYVAREAVALFMARYRRHS